MTFDLIIYITIVFTNVLRKSAGKKEEGEGGGRRREEALPHASHEEMIPFSHSKVLEREKFVKAPCLTLYMHDMRL